MYEYLDDANFKEAHPVDHKKVMKIKFTNIHKNGGKQ